jgi:hypothetical protein
MTGRRLFLTALLSPADHHLSPHLPGLFFCLLAAGAANAFAAAPTLDHVYPAGGQLGTTSQVTLIGKIDPWPPRFWVDDGAIRFVAGTNKGECSLEIDAKAAVGPHFIRIFNDDGASRPRFLLVDDQPQTREKEPNDELPAAQSIAHLPATINARLDKTGDVDLFAISLNAGQTLIASVDAYVLESPLDAVLEVRDARGVEQAWNHDGRTLDPFLVFTARESGRYIVQVMGFPHPATSEIRFHGNDKCVYRLHLNSGPFLSHTLPLGVSRAGHTKLELFGWNFASDTPREFDWVCQSSDDGKADLRLHAPSLENTWKLPCGDGPESIELEPNDTIAQARQVDVPSAISGCIQAPGDEDRFLFQAKKKERYRISVQSAALGFPVDAWLKIERTNSTQVERNDDRGGPDPELEWEAGSDGTFVVAVGNLLHRGGSNCLYRLVIRRGIPDYKATVSEHSLAILPGSTNELKVTLNRQNGFTNQIFVRLTGLPEGVSSEAIDVPEKRGDVTIKVVSATNAPPYNGVFRIITVADGKERAVPFSLVSTSEDNGVPGGFRELVIPSTEQLWLTVRRPPEQKKGDAQK